MKAASCECGVCKKCQRREYMRTYRAGKDGRINPTTGRYSGPEPATLSEDKLRPPADVFEAEYDSLYHIEAKLLGPRAVNLGSWQLIEYALRMGFANAAAIR
jgi:hypothetical protein